ncbi:STAS domain-containing protein [Streptomyces phaeolivaceus]|uniref:STAS domain-containing protein n=1 Tax=Streptomyces phaeolivaceus TaxID=2653200 RepID=A0A5P8K9H4_9ACTN|nr:STAS domain-containing protein [Streptomyces phaeolivaceus]QFQ99963.1 STAS domain-containing protein [Streptomyces phaeolivaceus]
MSSGIPPGLQIVDATTPAVLVLPGPVTRDEVPGLCAEVRARLEGTGGRPGGGVLVCDVAGIGPPGLAAVDVLARLQLAARRAGGRIRLRDPDPALSALLGFVGLAFDVEGQAEEGEPAGGVEEAVESGDPAL